MITASETLKNAIISPVRTITARVEFYEDSTLVHSFNHNDRLISFDVERVGEESKFFGFGICQKANIKLIDKNRELSFTTSHSIKIGIGTNTEMIYPYPTFYITEVRRDENTNQLSITAYDMLYDATGYTVSGLLDQVAESFYNLNVGDYLLPLSYSIMDFAYVSAAIIGANDLLIEGLGETETCFDTFYGEGANFNGDENIREALNDVAEATQTIYYIDRNDNLVFKRLDKDGEPVLTITKADYTTLKSGANRRLGGICHATELGDNVSATTEAAGTMQYVRDNAFWEMREDIASLVDAALAAVGGMTINQFNCSWRGNFLVEPGDKIALITKDNDTVHSYLLNDMVHYTGAFGQSTQWSFTESEETPSNPTNLGDALNQTFARVDKVNKEVEIVAGETAAIKMTNETIQASVAELDNNMAEVISQVNTKISAEDVELTVQKVVEENGINSITTTTGFTFNEEGLHISKDTSEITTTITEDGMTVSRENDDVLIADNLGVRAEDLHATTFLIIGRNSRFEDYNDSRTGCFWIRGS